jgi:hypothetical protein
MRDAAFNGPQQNCKTFIQEGLIPLDKRFQFYGVGKMLDRFRSINIFNN